MFTKQDRSTFKYWFAHWCAFQMTALNLGIWKFKYLFHDWEKPWLKLFLPYRVVQKYHREHSKHHVEYALKHGAHNVDIDAMVIDNECSRFTKTASPYTAIEWFERQQASSFDIVERLVYNAALNRAHQLFDANHLVL